MKSLFIFVLLLLSLMSIYGQSNEIDDLKKSLTKVNPDTTRAVLLNRLASIYRFNKPDSAIILIQQVLELSRNLNFTRGEVRALNEFGEALRFQGDYPKALATEFQALRISKDSHDPEAEATSLAIIASIYVQLNVFEQGLSYYRQALKIDTKLERTNILALSGIGDAFEKMNQLDSASLFQEQAYTRLKLLTRGNLPSLVMLRLGIIHARLGHTDVALTYYRSALSNANLMVDLINQGRIQYQIADLFYHSNQFDSSLVYARQAFITCHRAVQKSYQLSSSNLLVNLYRDMKNLDSAFYYQQIATGLNDSLYGPDKFQRLQLLASIEQQRQQEILQAQTAFKNKTRLYTLLAALSVFLFIAIILFRNNRQKQKINVELFQQKNEIQNTLTELKTTQAQLIQSEKMASLGELTAGIAHEIQNPLNFVNNFSDVNKELLLEMKEELNKGNMEEGKAMVNDIIANEEKINHHGKRAEGIVKGMLLHSQKSVGIKEPTDINALADEYLRMSYYSFQSKHKDSPEIKLVTNFEDNMPLVNVIPQDIGNVLLNLFNNAFWACSGEFIRCQSAGIEYHPEVKVMTRLSPIDIKDSHHHSLNMIITDNGVGIASNIIDKIFQPFFTTKPTGHGTGLGLSLVYDIVKAHSGEIKVDSSVNKGLSDEQSGSAFTILLPI